MANSQVKEANMPKLVSLVIAAILLFAGTAARSADEPTQAKQPLYAVAAEGKDATAEISKLAGVSPFFHLYTEKGEPVEVVPNPYLDLEVGTGPAAAQMLIGKGVVVLVARRIPGPKLMDVIDANNVRFVRRTGTVQDVANELRE
jgi:predicted Fe-Mo cluster-binding NifX family protein